MDSTSEDHGKSAVAEHVGSTNISEETPNEVAESVGDDQENPGQASSHHAATLGQQLGPDQAQQDIPPRENRPVVPHVEDPGMQVRGGPTINPVEMRILMNIRSRFLYVDIPYEHLIPGYRTEREGAQERSSHALAIRRRNDPNTVVHGVRNSDGQDVLHRPPHTIHNSRLADGNAGMASHNERLPGVLQHYLNLYKPT